MDAQTITAVATLVGALGVFATSMWKISQATKKINGTPERVLKMEHHMRAVRNIVDVMLEMEEHRMEDLPETPANSRLIAKLVRTRESLRELG